MDGFDLGVAALVRVLAAMTTRRRALLETIEPVWEGNQVWFILAGGAGSPHGRCSTQFRVLRLLYRDVPAAAAFILRPWVSSLSQQIHKSQCARLGLGSDHHRRRAALIFGVAFGNLFLGVPFRSTPICAWPTPVRSFGLLSPFALLCGLISLAMAADARPRYICGAGKADSAIASRAERVARDAALGFVVLYCAAGVWLAVRPAGICSRFTDRRDAPVESAAQQVSHRTTGSPDSLFWHPAFWAAPIAALATALALIRLLSAQRYFTAFVASATCLASTILSAGFALFRSCCRRVWTRTAA